MAFKFKDAGGVLQTVRTMKVLEGGTLRNIIRMKVMDSDDVTLRTVATFASTLSLSISPSSLFTSGTENVLISTTVVASPAGGLGPYTYSWSVTAGTATVNSPTSAVTSFTSGTLTAGETANATARCTCTDSSGQTATADIELGFFFYTPGY